MYDAIRKALGAATVEACNAVECCPRNGLCEDAGQCQHAPAMEYTAAAIAAFLEALPSLSALPVTDGFERVGISVRRSRALAAAVRRAAGG